MSESGINRRDLLVLAGAGAVGASLPQIAPAAGAAAPAAAAARPNIILYVPDEMRADALACYGNPVTRTPNFDRLAAEGTRFENCHVQFPVCGASRCSFLTGWPTSVRGHRSLYYFLRPDEPNLFRYLKDAGYDVIWLGKNDAFAAATFHSSVTVWKTGAVAPTGGGANPVESTPGVTSMLLPPDGDRRSTNDYSLVQEAIGILGRRESERPVCIFLAMFDPHPPYSAPADFHHMYDPRALPPLIPPGGARRPNFHGAIRAAYGLDRLSDESLRQVRAVYYGQVSYSDWLLGELMEGMQRAGRDKDTALIAFSDHGDYAGDYGLVEKWPSGLEDCLTHVPMIVRLPGGAPATVAPDMIEAFDIVATCLELAGTRACHTHFSRSLLPQAGGGGGDPARAAFTEAGYNTYEPQAFEPLIAGLYGPKTRLQNEHPETITRAASVRTRTHKLIVRPNGQSELYDCARDPGMRENLFGESSAAAVQAALQARLLNWYVNTSGIAPMDKDGRDPPPYYPTPSLPANERILLDH
ncbi:MAG TPA: sulfatase-like hydrolase/transferase [Steroidobacteraceae bacterium]|nr:sulfatase-like hydrolase/transferase [Steroidobacteraceae bacterium]